MGSVLAQFGGSGGGGHEPIRGGGVILDPLDPLSLLIERGFMPLLVAVFTEQIGWKVGNSVEKLWMVL